MIPKADTVADIGCDHGKLALMLYSRHKAVRIIASDISEPSLNKARKLFSGRQSKDVMFRTGDGLSVLHDGEADAIVIAGVGGIRIADMLSREMKKAKDAVLILAPNKAEDYLRRWLIKNGFRIIDEDLVKEGPRFYHLIKTAAGEDTGYEDIHFELGKILIQKKHRYLKPLIERKIKLAAGMMDTSQNSVNPRTQRTIKRAQARIKAYGEVLKWL